MARCQECISLAAACLLFEIAVNPELLVCDTTNPGPQISFDLSHCQHSKSLRVLWYWWGRITKAANVAETTPFKKKLLIIPIIKWVCFVYCRDIPEWAEGAEGQERRCFVLEGGPGIWEKNRGGPRVPQTAHSRMTFSRMLPPACHWNTVWLIKISVALNFHWHSTPQATLGALRQAIHREGKDGRCKKRGREDAEEAVKQEDSR